ncbi:2-hydroxychromene-2-carboxylate isomerase [Blastomonas marina]|jgi:predicted DsbA family dithiol-disulfide isomerase|uniref:2-hydroxychromene-2-carboxylate isomerase n=1 Tax=Blastomonas marina TaxID=1867408 RepID=A0ABQ1FD81_9SPHN|nr:DsbA family oxidoreductase [Blastomonas marina]GGA07784.1 2-hydroxychromene-2-carboxylate isomerase [Blastomonas marina]
MTNLSIDIYSDVMCPWCIIGYRNLLKALDELEGEIEVETRWRPFELNPDMPSEGEERLEHIARKYGRTIDQAREGAARMQAMAERVGYSFEWEGDGAEPPALMRNTFLAHKLLAHALDTAGWEVQTDLKLALFDAHFRDRRDVADREVLLELADAVGLDREAAAAALDDEALAQRIRAEERAAFDANITGVPAMVVAGKFLVPGAQEPETYVTALRRVAEKTA